MTRKKQSTEAAVREIRKGQRAAGCGKSRCYLCHLEKLLKRATLHQYRSDLSYREWRAEVGFPTPRLRRPDR